MKSLKVILVIWCVVLLNACAATLLPVSVTKNSSLDKYRYVYITPTSGITSTTGGVYGGSYGVYGSTQTKSIYPSDIIAGIMIKKGFTQVPNITPEIADQTLIMGKVVGAMSALDILLRLRFNSSQLKPTRLSAHQQPKAKDQQRLMILE